MKRISTDQVVSELIGTDEPVSILVDAIEQLLDAFLDQPSLLGRFGLQRHNQVVRQLISSTSTG